MDWGIDPERVSEIAEIIRNRRFSAPDAEKLMLAIVGGAGEHADSPLWDMAQILLGLGVLAKQPRLGPRDAAIACLLDETGMMIGPLKRGKEARHSLVAIASSAEGLTLTSGGEPRVYGWGRVKRAMGLADFLFNSPFVDPGAGNGVDALRQALDTLFAEEGDLTTLSKKAVQAPARYMRAWRKRYLPLQAFADLIRHREAFLAEHKRAHARDLDQEDIFTLWRFAVGRGETWSFTRYSEKLAALMREERTDNERRAFLAPVAIDGMVTGEPSEDPESAIIAWLDGEMEPDLAEAPIVEAPDDEGEEEKWTDRTMSALNALPDVPKMLTKEERRQAAAALALLPLAHEQPHTLLRAIAVAQWENRLIEATRRGKAEDQPSNLDYFLVHGELQALDQRLGELILIGLFLTSPAGGAAIEGGKILKKWRHDRASFRIEDAELAQTFTIMGHDLRAVANALKRILLQLGRLGTQANLTQLASADEPRFAAVFTERYNLKARM
jgi:hypothetical protein